MSKHRFPPSDTTNYTRSTYLGSDHETHLLIDILRNAEASPTFAAQRNYIRQMRLRLIWADHWQIFFHAEADKNKQYIHRGGDQLIDK